MIIEQTRWRPGVSGDAKALQVLWIDTPTLRPPTVDDFPGWWVEIRFSSSGHSAISGTLDHVVAMRYRDICRCGDAACRQGCGSQHDWSSPAGPVNWTWTRHIGAGLASFRLSEEDAQAMLDLSHEEDWASRAVDWVGAEGSASAKSKTVDWGRFELNDAIMLQQVLRRALERYVMYVQTGDLALLNTLAVVVP